MEEAPTKPDEPKKQENISLPKKLWETVDDTKPGEQNDTIVDLPLDYEADDATPEDAAPEESETAIRGAVSAGEVIAERYRSQQGESETKSIDDRRRELERRQRQAEAELGETFDIGNKGTEQIIELPKPGPEIVPEDMPESYFERRHEIKDEPAQSVSSSADEQAATDQSIGLVATSTTVQEDTDNLYSEEKNAFSGPFGDLSILSQGMYRQAIKGGFWAAVAILTLLAIIAVVS